MMKKKIGGQSFLEVQTIMEDQEIKLQQEKEVAVAAAEKIFLIQDE